jgi:bifunctional non-homologous end joining protein LigD
MSRREAIRVAGVAITHPNKVWWPDERLTKLDVVRFYERISPAILPWLHDRPLIAERCPGGMLGSCFFQKHFARGLPAGVPTVPIPAESVGRTVRYVVGGSQETLLALVNLGAIAVHIMNCRTMSLATPDWLAFDLDPSSGKFADAARAGQVLREILDDFGLRSYPKTSGGRGLHVLIPLVPLADQEVVRAFARSVADLVEHRAPELATVVISKGARAGRVFVDWLRNAFGHTIVPPYAARRRPGAPVSTPLDWDEVDPGLDPAVYNVRTIERRLADADPWADFWQQRQHLPDAAESHALA